MSSDDGGWRRELFVWTVLLCLKETPLSRVIVVREGISACEDRVI